MRLRPGAFARDYRVSPGGPTNGRWHLRRARYTPERLPDLDASAAFHEAEQIQVHLRLQDDAINARLDKVDALETTIARS